MLVCRSVTETGVCQAPPETLLVGKPYVLFVTGFRMPTGRVAVRMSRWAGARRVPLASRFVDVRGDATYFTNPLTIPSVGSYRIAVFDARGREFQHVDVRAPEASVHRVSTPPTH